MVKAIIMAAEGMGRPLKYFTSPEVDWTLKRANLKAPQTTKRKAASQPNLPYGLRAQLKASRAGAIPKETRSAKESYWTPNLEVAPESRATFPSRTSKTDASRMAYAAYSNFS